MFERLFESFYIKKLLKELKPEESEYAAYLTATLDDNKCKSRRLFLAGTMLTAMKP